MADENKPFIGYRSAGRRPERNNDRRAAADAPLAALRGAVSGVLGAPGDIESLVRMLPGLNERTVLPTSEDVERRLPMPQLAATPVGRAATNVGQLAGGFYAGPGSPLRAIASIPGAVSKAGRDFVMAAGQPTTNVIKNKGGNWLAGQVEKIVNPLKRDADLVRIARENGVPLEEEGLVESAALNSWLESKLAKYIRNEMATPEDPLRVMLQERGITHLPEQEFQYGAWVSDELADYRKAAGFPAEGMAVERHAAAGYPAGQAEALARKAETWEALSDNALVPHRAGDIYQRAMSVPHGQATLDANPWLAKVDPDTPVYSVDGHNAALGFEHIVDELRNALRADSDLPANLRLTPEQLSKITVPQAVERIAKIGDWRMEQARKATLSTATNPATHVFKEYPEQGYKWVELKAPAAAYDSADDATKQLWDQFRRDGIPEDEIKAHFGLDDASTEPLEQALKYEGEVMGHCVGGYCDSVASGRTQIFSLRDKKGEPHVTIEVRPANRMARHEEVLDEMRKRPDFDSLQGVEWDIAYDEALKSATANLPPEIIQIKGKQNAAPKDEYLPAVQDFIQSGNWSNIGDARNAGLRRFTDVFNSAELNKLMEAGAELPTSGYLTGEEIQRLHNLITPEGKRLRYDARGNIVDDGVDRTPGGLQRAVDEGIDWEPDVGHPANNPDRPRFNDGDLEFYAEGGAVMRDEPDDYDPATIAALAASLSEEF